MLPQLPLFIGTRYLKAVRRGQFVSFLALASIIGIALGVTVLVTVLSVMNGFETEMRARILDATAHVTVSGFGGLEDWRSLATEMEDLEGVTATAPYITGKGIVVGGTTASAVLLQGVDPERERRVSGVLDMVDEAALERLTPGASGIILGKALAERLQVESGDRLRIAVADADILTGGVPRLRVFEVLDVFELGMYLYDNQLALIHLNDALDFFGATEEDIGLRVRLEDAFYAPTLANQLQELLPTFATVSDWTLQHSSYFVALGHQKRMLNVILTLIIAVAAFNLVSGLVMSVETKRPEIAILRTMGAGPLTIMGIFMWQGLLIGLIGALLGVLGGMLLTANLQSLVTLIQNLLDVELLAAEVYYLSELPTDLRVIEVSVIAATALVLSLLATIYPAWRASRQRPADELRHG